VAKKEAEGERARKFLRGDHTPRPLAETFAEGAGKRTSTGRSTPAQVGEEGPGTKKARGRKAGKKSRRVGQASQRARKRNTSERCRTT